MKLRPTTSLNDAIRRISAGHAGAASVVAMLVKEYPENAMDYLRAMDNLGLYGADVWYAYEMKCGARILPFLGALSTGKF